MHVCIRYDFISFGSLPTNRSKCMYTLFSLLASTFTSFFSWIAEQMAWCFVCSLWCYFNSPLLHCRIFPIDFFMTMVLLVSLWFSTPHKNRQQWIQTTIKKRAMRFLAEKKMLKGSRFERLQIWRVLRGHCLLTRIHSDRFTFGWIFATKELHKQHTSMVGRWYLCCCCCCCVFVVDSI